MAAALVVLRADSRDAPDPAAHCEALARSGGPTRRALAAAAGSFVDARAWERLGFARLTDYAVERLGISGRELQDLARTDAALHALPRVDSALVAGHLSWTKARLLVRVATAEDEERWLALAKSLTARALSREVRRMDVESLEAGGSVGAGEDDGGTARETLQLRCSPVTKAKWHRVRMLAPRVAGHPMAAWQCAEAAAAEVLSAVGLEAADVPADEEAGGTAVGPENVREASPRTLPRAEHRSVRSRGERADAFALDAELHRLVGAEQRAAAELAEVLLDLAEAGRHRARGFSTWDSYVREALGMSPRRARMLLRLARTARKVSALRQAWQAGSLSFLRAHALVPVTLAAPAHAAAWVERARAVPCRQLEEEVDAAMLAADLDPAGFAADGAVPSEERASTSPPTERQVGAQATAPGETCRLMLNGPRDVIRLLRATLCTVQRRIERRTGRRPTPGEAFEAMLDHALGEWLLRSGGKTRRAERVYSRDGWRCTVPGCSSYRNLEDHHIVFRSRGGSNALSNRTTLCSWHHHRGVHAWRVRCTGSAPDGLRFELGLRSGTPPLIVYGPRE